MGPGEKLDALVAEKVMGWREVRKVTSFEAGADPYTGLPFTGYFGGPPDFPEENIGQPVPAFSVDIADAWLVVEEMAKRSNALALQAPGSTDMNEAYRKFTRWTADFGTNNISGYTEANGDTAPHAICLAALKIVGYSFSEEG